MSGQQATGRDLGRSGNYFELLGVAVGWQPDQRLIADNYRRLQAETHPDRFASASEVDRRRAVQLSSRLNDAFHTLKHPVKRAAYLLDLAGHTVNTDSLTFDDPMFLMQQMELREQLSACRQAEDPEQALEALMDEAEVLFAQVAENFATALNNQEFDKAQAEYAKLQFVDKLQQEAEALEGALLDD